MINKKNKPMQIKINDWLEFGKLLFGDDYKKWKFKCAKCGNIQSVDSITEHNPKLEFGHSKVYFCCEGIFNKKYGCNWSLNGKIQIHKIEIIGENGNSNPAFEFYLGGSK